MNDKISRLMAHAKQNQQGYAFNPAVSPRNSYPYSEMLKWGQKRKQQEAKSESESKDDRS